MSRFPDGPYKGRRAERAGAPQQPSAPSLAAPSQTAAYNAPPERRIADLEQEIIALKNQMALYNNSLYVDSTPPADKDVRVWRSASGKWLNQALPFGVDAPGNWKLFYSDGSGVVTELAVGADGTVLTSTGTSAAPAFEAAAVSQKVVIKTADETITDDATLSDDADLLFAVAANEKWQFEGTIIFSTPTNRDFKYTFTGPSGSAGSFGSTTYADAGTALAAASASAALGTAKSVLLASNGPFILHFWGAIANGGTAGNLTFQWAQDIAGIGGSTTVEAGSYIKYLQQ